MAVIENGFSLFSSVLGNKDVHTYRSPTQYPGKRADYTSKLCLPVIILVGRAQADSSVTADSWRYTPESVDPGRKAGTPHLGSLDYLEGLTD